MSCQPTGNPQGIWRLLVYYRMLLKLLDTYFSGYLMVEDDGMARNYTRLCSKIRGIMEQEGLEHLADKNWQPYPSLRTLTSDDVDWDEWTRSRICGLFLSEVEEEFVNGDEKDFPLSEEDERALGEILTYISSYAKAKAASEAEWLRDMQRRAEKARALPQVPPGARVPLDFAFVMDSRLRELLIAYWTEAESAMKHGLHTSAVLLCGSVVEAILVDALSHEPDKAKFDYYQKYLEGKDK